MWCPCLSAFAEGVNTHDLRKWRSVVGVFTCEVTQPAVRCDSLVPPAQVVQALYLHLLLYP